MERGVSFWGAEKKRIIALKRLSSNSKQGKDFQLGLPSPPARTGSSQPGSNRSEAPVSTPELHRTSAITRAKKPLKHLKPA